MGSGPIGCAFCNSLPFDRDVSIRKCREYRGKSEREKVATELGSGTSADIVQLNPPWMGDFVSNGDFFVDLGQYGYDIEGFDKKLIDNYCTYNGTLITLPSGLNARCYIMNKTKLDEFGIPSGLDTAWTWDDLITIGRNVHEKNPVHSPMEKVHWTT